MKKNLIISSVAAFAALTLKVLLLTLQRFEALAGDHSPRYPLL